uniref:Uncharacterized protein n=1 Tax=Arion vulgaris TaxID=1028688 RepID=A0A0B7BMA0_9EUPU
MCISQVLTKDMHYLLDYPAMEDRTRICRARVYLRVNAETQHPLHRKIRREKASRLKTGKSWMGQAEDCIQ